MGKKQTITIGGNRLGSGEKMKTAINGYDRSTHNLSTKVATSMAPGVLYPISVIPAMRGDAFEIDLDAEARTIPTKGALFGSYKLQIDVFQCPVRLYQAILHNNPTAIGLKMADVKFPVMRVYTYLGGQRNGKPDDGKLSNNCLLKYLGISGTGQTNEEIGSVKWREFNAIPLLAYYDIYKTYYANKQEELGYIIGANYEEGNTAEISGGDIWQETEHYSHVAEMTFDQNIGVWKVKYENTDRYSGLCMVNINGTYLSLDTVEMSFDNTNYQKLQIWSNQGILSGGNTQFDTPEHLDLLYIYVPASTNGGYIYFKGTEGAVTEQNVIKEFDLKFIDDMRYTLLSQHTLGTAYIVNNFDNLPYCENFDLAGNKTKSKYPMIGLALKTYQNDMFNNWLNLEWLEGDNSISEITAVSVVNGSFTMDSMNFAQKLYNMLNRIILAGNTYEDWQDVVYEEVKRRQIESPIFCGGMSREIMFDEVLQTAPTEGQPLGTIGGRGRFADGSQKGGKIRIKVDEASYIITIASLTPRVFYTQGNEFYMTDQFSMDDWHKPALDGIGYQDLVGERLNWHNTIIQGATGLAPATIYRDQVGKLPAWMDYMTNIDRAYGDFAENDGKGYMILNRNYTDYDFTTYVDPSKYNYVFADASLTAQNFWLFFIMKIKARRLMSARIIPNV